MNVNKIREKYIYDKSFSSLSSEQQKKILAKNQNAEKISVKRAKKYTGKSDNYFKAAEKALELINSLSHASTVLLIHLKKTGLNGTAQKTADIDKAVSQLRSTLDKERRLLHGQGSGNPRLDEIMERQMMRDY